MLYVSSNQIKIKNNGEESIDLNTFIFYLNGTKCDVILYSSPDPNQLRSGEIAVFNILGSHNGNYTIRVTGPYGVAEEVFAEI